MMANAIIAIPNKSTIAYTFTSLLNKYFFSDTPDTFKNSFGKSSINVLQALCQILRTAAKKLDLGPQKHIPLERMKPGPTKNISSKDKKIKKKWDSRSHV